MQIGKYCSILFIILLLTGWSCSKFNEAPKISPIVGKWKAISSTYTLLIDGKTDTTISTDLSQNNIIREFTEQEILYETTIINLDTLRDTSNYKYTDQKLIIFRLKNTANDTVSASIQSSSLFTTRKSSTLYQTVFYDEIAVTQYRKQLK